MCPTIVRFPIPKAEFHLQGTGHDLNRVIEACKDKLHDMERKRMDPFGIVNVEVPAEDDTLGR